MDGGGLNFGDRIREIRKRRRLTLERVSALTNLSIGFLSQVERNITRPSLTSLVTIARVLDVPVSSLLYQPDLANVISRGDNRVAHLMDDERASYERLSSVLPSRMLSAIKINVPPRYASSAAAYEGEEIVYVLDGTVRYVIDGTIYELQAGDSLHYSTRRPRHISNPTDRAAALLSIGTSLALPDGEDHERDRLDGIAALPPAGDPTD